MTFACGAQREYAEQLVHVAQWRLAPLPADLAHRDNLADRLNGFVFSMFVEMEGAGGLDWHKLSRKGGDGADLTDEILHEAWPDGASRSPEAQRLFVELSAAIGEAQELHSGPAEAMRHLAVAFALAIERDYSLIPLYYDEEDVDAGPDIAPALSVAVAAQWERSMAVAR